MFIAVVDYIWLLVAVVLVGRVGWLVGFLVVSSLPVVWLLLSLLGLVLFGSCWLFLACLYCCSCFHRCSLLLSVPFDCCCWLFVFVVLGLVFKLLSVPVDSVW